MSHIKTFPFEKEKFNQIREYHFGKNWPVVYIMENGKEAYVGETTSAYSRSRQHFDNVDRKGLKNIHIITDEEYNKSAALDIEAWLIQYLVADGVFKLQNGNGGLQNHNYYDREKYKAKFETIWESLRAMSLVKNDLVQLRNTDLFKYSPYKSLSEDQVVVVNELLKKIQNSADGTYIVNGKPGTGKTILAVYLMKLLKELPETKHMNVGLVVPMTSLRSTLKKVFKNIKDLKPGMVIGPNDVVKQKYDLLIVDEAHRLKRRVNIVNYNSFDNTNKLLGFGKEGTELDWIMRSSKHQLFFYDKDQSVKPTDVPHHDFNKLNAEHFELMSQQRISAGKDFIDFVNDLFELRTVDRYEFPAYDFKIYDDAKFMVDDIKKKDKELGLCRVVAGLAWSWETKGGRDGHDIEIDGLKLKWNSVAQDWVNSPNSLNEVGCIHTVQGYDLNYVGVIIGPEISYDPMTKQLVINPEKYTDVNGGRGVTDLGELKRYIINIYKTLLTRGIKGVYVYIVDENLRDYFKNATSQSNPVVQIPNIVNDKLKESIYFNRETVRIPLYESVGCGELMFANTLPEDFLNVDAKYIAPGAKYFVLRVSGDSMNQAGINDGDYVLCQKEYNPSQGKNVVALIGEDATIKEFWKEGNTVILKPKSSNSKHQIMKFSEDEEVFVQGVVLRVLKDADYQD